MRKTYFITLITFLFLINTSFPMDSVIYRNYIQRPSEISFNMLLQHLNDQRSPVEEIYEIQKQILNKVGIKLQPQSIAFYDQISKITPIGKKTAITASLRNLGRLYPDAPALFHQSISLDGLDVPTKRERLVNILESLPEDQRINLVPQIQEEIAFLYGRKQEKDYGFIPFQKNAESCNDTIQNLIIRLGHLSPNGYIILINAQHIIKTHGYKDSPNHQIINQNNEVIYYVASTDFKLNKTIFPKNILSRDKPDTEPDTDFLLQMYRNANRPFAQNNEEDLNGEINLFPYENMFYETVTNNDNTQIKTAYPIFIFHDYDMGPLEIKIKIDVNFIENSLIVRSSKEGLFERSFEKETLIDFARLSTKNLKYEKTINEKLYVILDIGHAMKEKVNDNIWPMGIYLMIEKTREIFPPVLFPNLYSQTERDTFQREEIESKFNQIIRNCDEIKDEREKIEAKIEILSEQHKELEQQQELLQKEIESLSPQLRQKETKKTKKKKKTKKATKREITQLETQITKLEEEKKNINRELNRFYKQKNVLKERERECLEEAQKFTPDKTILETRIGALKKKRR
jgi:hypothetical protein